MDKKGKILKISSLIMLSVDKKGKIFSDRSRKMIRKVRFVGQIQEKV